MNLSRVNLDLALIISGWLVKYSVGRFYDAVLCIVAALHIARHHHSHMGGIFFQFSGNKTIKMRKQGQSQKSPVLSSGALCCLKKIVKL